MWMKQGQTNEHEKNLGVFVWTHDYMSQFE